MPTQKSGEDDAAGKDGLETDLSDMDFTNAKVQCFLCTPHKQLEPDVRSIPAEDILHMRVMKKKTKQTTPEIPSARVNLRSHVLLVRYLVRFTKNRLRMNTCMFFGTEEECSNLFCEMNRKREAVWGKPVNNDSRKMLVMINPISGRGLALSVYYQRVKPFFTMCGITAEVIVSTHAGHISDIAKDYDFTGIDGVVAIGGDGTYNETLTGLLKRSMTEAKLDFNDVNCDVKPQSIPCGFVSAGSGSWMASHLFQTTDPVTQAIHIIRDYKMPLGGLSVHCDGQLVCYTFLVQHIGFVGDILYHCNQNRWMGPSMYFVIPLTTLFKRRRMAATFKMYLEDESSREKRLDGSTSIDTEVKVKEKAGTPVNGSTSEGKNQKVSTPTPVPGPSNSSNCCADHWKEMREVEKAVRKTSMSSRTEDTPSTSGSSSADTGHWTPGSKETASDLSGCEWTFGCEANAEERLGMRPHWSRDLPSGSWTEVADLTSNTSATGSPGARYPAHDKDSSPRPVLHRAVSWNDLKHAETLVDTVFYNVFFDCMRSTSPEGNLKLNTSEDSMHLQVLKNCSASDLMNQLAMLRDNTPGMINHSSVISHQVRAMKMTLSKEEEFKNKTFYLTNDGESMPLLGDTYFFRWHPRVLQVFGMPDSGTL